MRLQNMPTGSLGRLALGLLALLCVLYAFYIAFLMPPLLKYGTSGVRVDGRSYCAAARSSAELRSYIQDPINTGPSKFPELRQKLMRESAVVTGQVVEAACLAQTAVNTPLLIFRAAVLLIIGAVFALLASRLRTN